MSAVDRRPQQYSVWLKSDLLLAPPFLKSNWINIVFLMKTVFRSVVYHLGKWLYIGEQIFKCIFSDTSSWKPLVLQKGRLNLINLIINWSPFLIYCELLHLIWQCAKLKQAAEQRIECWSASQNYHVEFNNMLITCRYWIKLNQYCISYEDSVSLGCLPYRKMTLHRWTNLQMYIFNPNQYLQVINILLNSTW
jgi:hypothetical protein